MFNINYNTANMVNIKYNMFGKLYETKQIIGEDLIQPLITNKKQKINTQYKDMFIYEKYQIFESWDEDNNMLPRRVPNEDKTFRMKYIYLDIAYENYECYSSDGFVIYVVLNATKKLYFQDAYTNNAVTSVNEVSQLPDELYNNENEEDSKKFDISLLANHGNITILKIVLSDLEQTSGEIEYEVRLPMYLDQYKTELLTSLKLNLSAVKVNGPVGD